MKLHPSTPLNDAIQRIANGNQSAGAVIALIARMRPDNLMAYLRVLDKKGLYGADVASLFWDKSNADFETFIRNLTLGNAEAEAG